MGRKVVLGVLLLLVVLAVGVVVYLRSFNPDYDGRIIAGGLTDPVIVTRNALGVPFIQAQGEEDLFFAWGYVNAQDRMFQMEVARRAGQGRLSEFAGEGALSKDLFLRAMGFYELAQQEQERLPPWIRRNLQRYVDGVNLSLERNGVSPQMRLLGLKQETWAPADPIVVGMMLNWVLAGNMRIELLYHQMAQKLGHEGCQRLLNLDPPHTPTIMEGMTTGGSGPTVLPTLMRTLGPLAGSQSASNNWVVGPRRSAYRGPILANDPHVHDSKIPSDFCLVRLKTPQYELAGGQVAGLPVLPFGYNRHMAWGVTNNGADIVDLFIETVDEPKGTYLAGGTPHPLRVKKETFQVKGKGPVERTLRWVGRRPLVSEVFPQLGGPVSLDWIGFEGATIEGFFHLHRARNYTEFLQAARKIGITAQNMVYADDQGNIAYQLIGLLPNRRGGTGNFPQQGAAVQRNWDGALPAERNPGLLNPKDGFIATANNKVVTDLSTDMNGTYAPRYRYERIRRMLLERDRIDVAYVKQMQLDSSTELAKRVLPLMYRHVRPRDGRATSALEALLAWDGNVSPDSAAAAMYNTFLVRFMFQTFADELGEALAAEYVGQRYISLERFLSLVEEGSDFFDDTRTPEREGVGEIATRAFHETLQILAHHTGSDDPAAWSWGKLHVIRYDHVLGRSRPLARLVNFGPFPFQGDCETNNRAHFTEVAPPFTTALAAGLRLIVAFDPQPRGEMMLITGQNEWFMSRHYTDMSRLWLQGQYFSVEGSEAAYRMEMIPAGR